MVALRLQYALLAVLNTATLVVAAQQAPVSRMENFRETFHGQELVDPYHWLEQTDAAETRKWIDAQNAYTHRLIDGQPIRSQISRRLTEMGRHDHIGAPLLRNGYYYFERRGTDQGLTGQNPYLLYEPLY